jgi:hypothetical protein
MQYAQAQQIEVGTPIHDIPLKKGIDVSTGESTKNPEPSSARLSADLSFQSIDARNPCAGYLAYLF